MLTPLKSSSKRHDRFFVQSSKIFVWGAGLGGCYDLFVTSLQEDTKDDSMRWFSVDASVDAMIFL